MDRDVEPYRMAFEHVAGEFMGSNRRRGFTYTWIPKHLADASHHASPRSFVVAIGKAAESAGRNIATPIDYRGIHEGVRAASRTRSEGHAEARAGGQCAESGPMSRTRRQARSAGSGQSPSFPRRRSARDDGGTHPCGEVHAKQRHGEQNASRPTSASRQISPFPRADEIPWPPVHSPPRPACTWPPSTLPSTARAGRCAGAAPSARACPATPRRTRTTAWTTPPAALGAGRTARTPTRRCRTPRQGRTAHHASRT